MQTETGSTSTLGVVLRGGGRRAGRLRPDPRHRAGVLLATAATLALVSGFGSAAVAQDLRLPVECQAAADRTEAGDGSVADWDQLAVCGVGAVPAFAAAIRASAEAADPGRLDRLVAALASLRHERLETAALELSRSRSATVPARLMALLVALRQVEPRVALVGGARLETLLADTERSTCHLGLGPADPGVGPSARGAERLAVATADIYGGDGPPSVRLFARCVRLALVEWMPLVVPDRLIVFGHVCDDQFVVRNEGAEDVDVDYITDPAREEPRRWLVVRPGREVRFRTGSQDPVVLGYRGRTLDRKVPGGRRCRPGVVTGIVRDTSGSPVDGADVVALASQRTERTSRRGTFLLDDLEPGPEILIVRAIGRDPERHALTVLPGDTLTAEVVLGRPVAQTLPEIVVGTGGRRYPPKLATFARRKLTGATPASRFIDPDTYDALAKFDLGNVLRRGGLEVGGEFATCPENRRGGFGLVRGQVVVYIDGTRLPFGDRFDVRRFPVEWFQAVEVYLTADETPIEYQTSATGCVIVLWTK